jgi:hypothetical protein
MQGQASLADASNADSDCSPAYYAVVIDVAVSDQPGHDGR